MGQSCAKLETPVLAPVQKYDYMKDPAVTNYHKEIYKLLESKNIRFIAWMTGNDFYLVDYDAYIVLDLPNTKKKNRWFGTSKVAIITPTDFVNDKIRMSTIKKKLTE